jgi:hypothetical protein
LRLGARIELMERKVSDLERDSRRNLENFEEMEVVVGRWKLSELFVVSLSVLGSFERDLVVVVVGFSISSWRERLDK